MTATQVTDETIAAIATPPGQGGVGVIRISGSKAASIAKALLGSVPKPRFASLSRFRAADGSVLDEGIAIYFQSPASFTGEDVLELQGHGGPAVLDLVLQRALELGARLARPGEFSERAFLHGKLDLAQAEAIADLIEAGSEASTRAALRSLTGEFSKEVHAINNALIDLRMYVESAIDFPEEEIDFIGEGGVSQRLQKIQQQLQELFARCQQGRMMREGITVVLAGAPNAGKSSLMNALARQDTAIVSSTPGTTRDVLREHVILNNLPVHLVDTAGLREAIDEIESEGVRRAQAVMRQADHILLLQDDSLEHAESIDQSLPKDVPVTRVLNKIDLSGRSPGACGEHCFAIAAKTGAGIDELIHWIEQQAGFHPEATGSFSARRRHLDALTRAQASLQQGQQQLETAKAGELLAEDLLQAQRALGEITGEFTSDDLLGEIFSSFCIGK
jgi:tRNA modification GTPase